MGKRRNIYNFYKLEEAGGNQQRKNQWGGVAEMGRRGELYPTSGGGFRTMDDTMLMRMGHGKGQLAIHIP